MTKELFIAALHKHLSDRVLLDLVLSELFTSAESITSVMSCLEPLVPAEKYGALLELPLEQDAETLGATLNSRGVQVVLASSLEYPSSLRGMKKPPPVLYVQGSTAVMQKTGFGICGSRKASDKGVEIAHRFGEEVAKLGVPEVSGYARGVDTAAHLGALQAGGSTIVVLAEGILNFRLKKDFAGLPGVADRMVAVSEFHPSRPWSVHAAMQRNGTICALSETLVVVEAQATGGTINAGAECLRQGKPLLVVQFGKESVKRMPEGNVELIKKGGRPVRTLRELAKQLRVLNELHLAGGANAARQLELSISA